MGVALATLAARLEDKGAGPDGFDYEQAVVDAVAQLSQDAPIVTSATLAIVSGTASYALPADFLFVIDLPALATSDNVLLSDGGIVPLATDWEERWYVEGDQVRFEPTPAYTLTRTLRYAAGHVLAEGAWPRLTENGARIALLYAQYLALQAKAQAAGDGGWRYRIGDEEVDKSRLGSALLEQAKGAMAGYAAAVRQLKGYGGLGRLGSWEC
jgi:hypothetical protein